MNDTIKNGLKKLPKRIEFWLLFLIVGILIDELIKEGYPFRFEDLFNLIFTHEKIIVIIGILWVSVAVYRRVKKES